MFDEKKIWKELKQFEMNDKRNTRKVLRKIREQINPYKYNKLRDYLFRDCIDKIYNLKISNKPTLNDRCIQKEPYWFKQAWVYQTCGACGDDYSGTINIPIITGMYLCFDFSC